MLVLFDIDGTLLLTHGEGMRAMQDAGRELYQPSFSIDGVDFSGRLDPLIWTELCAMNGVVFDKHSADQSGAMGKLGFARGSAFNEDTAKASDSLPHGVLISSNDQHHARFRRAYERHLRRRLDNGARVTLLPGVRELLDSLRAREAITLGLVTGNYPETGRLKIERAGLDFDIFTVFGWGCDGAHRRELPLRAIEHCRSVHGRDVAGEEVVIIGDTPHDIDCARHNGCRSIGVATGAFSMDVLREHGADFVVADLSDTNAILHFVSNLT